MTTTIQGSCYVIPVLQCDWNEYQCAGKDIVTARTDPWTVKPGDKVLLDDREGCKCYGMVVSLCDFSGEGRTYARCRTDGEFIHYEVDAS